MSELEIRHRLESAARPAFGTPVDAAADLARGRRGRRRRRAVQASAAGASACAIAGVTAVAGVPFVGVGATNPADGPSPVATSPDPSAPTQHQLDIGRVEPAVRDHLGLEHSRATVWVGENEPLGYAGEIPLHDDGESEAKLLLRDDVRDDGAPVPLRCANDPAYDTCERDTLPGGSEIVVGQGEDDLLVAAWGSGGDLVEVTAHWGDGAEHNVTLDQLIALVGDDRLYVDDQFDVRQVG